MDIPRFGGSGNAYSGIFAALCAAFANAISIVNIHAQQGPQVTLDFAGNMNTYFPPPTPGFVGTVPVSFSADVPVSLPFSGWLTYAPNTLATSNLPGVNFFYNSITGLSVNFNGQTFTGSGGFISNASPDPGIRSVSFDWNSPSGAAFGFSLILPQSQSNTPPLTQLPTSFKLSDFQGNPQAFIGLPNNPGNQGSYVGSFQALATGPTKLDASPTPLQLANLSNNVYSGNAGVSAMNGGPNFNYIGDNSSDPYKGLRAATYISTNLTQVVIAFRGTDLNDGDLISIKDIMADKSFSTGTPSANLIASVQEAVNYVRGIQNEFPNANITLTGHSLGGAVAQIIGKATGYATDAFDAPGAGNLYNNLLTSVSELSALSKSPLSGANVNYRMYGDLFRRSECLPAQPRRCSRTIIQTYCHRPCP